MRGPFAYYPGCWLAGSATEYAESTEEIFGRLELALEEIPGWSCCGAASAHQTAPQAGHALSAHNLSLAAATGKPLVVPCSVCYGNLLAAKAALADGTFHPAKGGIDAREAAGVEVTSPLEVLSAPGMPVELARQAAESLDGFKVACYYGCLLTRPPSRVHAEDTDNPLSMERIIGALGGETVEWAYKTECCGAALGKACEQVAVELVAKIILAAEDAGANCLAVACPLCHRNLDVLQFEASKAKRRKVEMPVFYFTELVAIAMDLPRTEKWLKKHLTTVFPLVDKVLVFE